MFVAFQHKMNLLSNAISTRASVRDARRRTSVYDLYFCFIVKIASSTAPSNVRPSAFQQYPEPAKHVQRDVVKQGEKPAMDNDARRAHPTST